MKKQRKENSSFFQVDCPQQLCILGAWEELINQQYVTQYSTRRSIKSVVASCDVNVPAPRNSGLDCVYISHMGNLVSGVLSRMVAHDTSLSYRWCWWTFGEGYRTLGMFYRTLEDRLLIMVWSHKNFQALPHI